MAAFYDWAAGEVLGDQHRTVHNELGYIKRGSGSPEGVETADIGSIFIRSNGGTDTVLYIKESGSGNTGWVAVGSISGHIADTSDAHDASAVSVLDTAAQITATDVEGALAEIVDASQAHDIAADPHTGYRLESADHAHTSTGAQAGTLDHGTALTGLSDDDHPQYMLESLFDAAGDLITATADNTPAKLARGSDDQVLRATATTIAWESEPFSITFVLSNNGAVIPTGIFPVWRALFPCTVTAVYAQVDTGITTVVNAGTGIASAEDFCSANIIVDPADAWEAGTVNQNQAITAGETVSVEVVTAGTALVLTIQIDLTRP